MQTDFIISQFHEYSRPMIIMGDCNMRPGSRGWRKLTNDFQDAWNIGGKGAGYTYPSLHPRTRLDYIFVSKILRLLRQKLLQKCQ